MADNIQEVQEQQIDPSAQLAEQMAIALNGGIPPQAAPTIQATTETTQQVTAAPVDTFNVFKEKFGWEAPEAAIQEIEQLRAFKATPPVAEYKFANPESERLIKAIDSGDLKTVHSILGQQLSIDSLTTAELNDTTAAEIVKLGMSLKYKDLTSKEIDHRFNKQFGLPPKPVQGSSEEPEEYQDRLSAWENVVEEKKMDLMIEAKLAKPEIQGAKTKLVFPEINQPVDEEYIQWKKTVEEQNVRHTETTEAYKAFSPKTIETKISFKDEPNKIDFEFQYEPDAESFSQAVGMTSDVEKFWTTFQKPDGNPDRQKFLKAIHFANNSEKIILEAMNQAKNATIKAMLPDNSQGGLVRQMVTAPGEPSELDKEMERRGIVRR